MFNVKLRRLRKKSKQTQAQLAKKLSVSPSTIGMYEQGRREPDSATLLKIANLFKVSVDFFWSQKNRKEELKTRKKSRTKLK